MLHFQLVLAQHSQQSPESCQPASVYLHTPLEKISLLAGKSEANTLDLYSLLSLFGSDDLEVEFSQTGYLSSLLASQFLLLISLLIQLSNIQASMLNQKISIW